MQHSARARKCGERWKVASGVDVRELRSEHLHEEGTRAHHAYHAKPRPTVIDAPHTPLDKSTHKRHVQWWLVAVAMRADAEMRRQIEINGIRNENRMRFDRVPQRCQMELLWKVTCFQIRRYRELYRFALPCKSLREFHSLSRVSHPVQKGTAKSERRRYFHQLMSQSSWLINETLLHRHLHLQTATAPTRRRLRCRAAKQPKRHHCESFPLGWLCPSVSAKWNWKTRVEQHQTRRQLLIPSPLTNEKLLGNTR